MNGVCEFRKKTGNRSGSEAPVPNPMTFRPELTPFTRYRGVKIQLFTFTLHLLGMGSGA